MDVSIDSNNKMNNIDRTSLPPIDLTNIDADYICPYCQNLLNNVHQTYDCGCRFCFECLNNVLKDGNGSCPSCETELTSDTKVPDKYFQKKISRLKINCQFKNCNWTGVLIDYNDHYNEHYVPKIRSCEFCRMEFNKKSDLEEHLNDINGTCQEQPVFCPYSKINCYINAKEPYNNNSVLINDQEWENSEILDITPTVPDIRILKRKDLENHLTSNLAYHLELLFKNTNKRLGKLEIDQKYENPSNISLTSLDLKPNLVSQLSTDDYGYSGSGSVNSQMSQNIDIIQNHSDIESKINDMNTKIDMFEINQTSLVNDFTRLVKVNEVLKQDNSCYKEEVKEYKIICTDLKRCLALTQVNYYTLEEKLLNQENASYNGKLLWKITDVYEKIQAAKSGHQNSIYSNPFYTDKYGYKMCARIYFNGDGQGRNTHFSVFFVLLKGEYDALLSWPFKQKCTFILIDQSENDKVKNISDSFRPDPNSISFKKPRNEMNIASGLPLFCPLSKLLDKNLKYVKDNTMFIKLIVDTTDLIGVF